MVFRDVMDELCLSAADVAGLFDVPLQSVRQWRLDSANVNHRRPPAGWQKKLLPIARKRAGKVSRVVEYLEGQGSSNP